MTATAQVAVQEKRLTRRELAERAMLAASFDTSADREYLQEYITLLRQQAAKSRNRHKALKVLNRVYLAVALENRWLRDRVHAFGYWHMLMKQAKDTLWAAFKKEQRTGT